MLKYKLKTDIYWSLPWRTWNTRLRLRDHYPSDDGMRCTTHMISELKTQTQRLLPLRWWYEVYCTHTWYLNNEHKLTDREYLRQELLSTGVLYCMKYFVAGASAVSDGPGCPGNCLSKGNLCYCCGSCGDIESTFWIRWIIVTLYKFYWRLVLRCCILVSAISIRLPAVLPSLWRTNYTPYPETHSAKTFIAEQ